MALKYKIEGVPKGMLPMKELTMAPALRAPSVVKFRPESDMGKVAEDVLKHTYARVIAAMGAGKTTVLPHALAKKTGKLVIYTNPNRLMAISTHDYMVKKSLSDSTLPPVCRYYEKIEKDMPRTGVMYCGLSEYVSMMLRSARRGNVLSSHVLVIDEAHSCDAWTYISKNLGLSYGATHLVEMSATFDAEMNVMRETQGEVIERVFPAVPMSEWRVHEPGKPWSFTNVKDNVVVFTDSRAEAAHMKVEYEDCGFSVYRLVAGMPEETFTKAMIELKNRRGVIVALIADSSFRDGFTFDATVVLDSGRVGINKCVGGQAVRSYRELYKLERKQTAGRFARVGKARATYYYPDVAYPSAICDLAPLEMEAVAYVYRLLGYMPGVQFDGAIMKEAVLPFEYEFATVVNSGYPLQCYVVDEVGRPRTPPPSYVDLPVKSQTMVRDLSSGGSVASGVSDAKSRVSSVSTAGRSVGSDISVAFGARKDKQGLPAGVSSVASGSSVGASSSLLRDAERRLLSTDSLESRGEAQVSAERDGVLDAYDRMKQAQPGKVVLQPGQYCHVASMPQRPVSMRYFPRALDSVDKYFPAGSSIAALQRTAAKYPDDFRDGAIELVSARYNTLNAYMRAVGKVLQEASVGGWSAGARPRFFEEIDNLTEQYNEMEAERLTMLVRIKGLADGYHRVTVLEAEVPAELGYANKLRSRLRKLARGSERDVRASIERMAYDAQQMSVVDGVSRRSIEDSMTVELSTHARYEIDKYQPAWWTGCREIKKWYDDRGDCVRTSVEFNALGEFATGLKGKDRGLAIAGSSRITEID